MERYALILFDFNSAKIKDRNQAIVNHITERVLAFPEVIVNITGTPMISERKNTT